MRQRAVLAVCGMDFEAAIARRAGCRAVYGREFGAVARQARAAVAEGVAGLVSFGTAGALIRGLAPGDTVLADAVLAPATGERWAADAAWLAQLLAALPGARVGRFVASDTALASGKRAVGVAHAAIAVDMESHWVARLAAEADVPFAVLRVIIDAVDTELPRAALAGMRGDGTTDIAAVIGALARRPAELPALLRLGRDAGRAKRHLRQVAAVLAPGNAAR